MMAQASTSPARIHIIDALRGCAIGGILTSIVLNFDQSIAYPPTEILSQEELPNLIVWQIGEALISQRFIAIFSFLFGFGVAMQWSRSTLDPVTVRIRHVRRMLALAVIGAFNTSLFWWGEILLVYAVIGMLLLLVHRCSARLLMLLAAIAFAVTDAGLEYVLFAPGRATALEHFYSVYPPELIADISRAGTFLEGVRLRWMNYWLAHYFDGPWLRMSVAMMLFGLGAGRTSLGHTFFAEPMRFARHWWPIALLGVVFIVAVLLGFSARVNIHESKIKYVVTSLGLLCSTFTIAWGFVLAAQWFPNRWPVRVFAPIGRLSLTTYVGGATVFALIFNPYGFGMGERFDRFDRLVLALTTYCFLGVFAHRWLRRFRQGPLEALLRRVSDGRPSWAKRIVKLSNEETASLR